MTLRADQLPAGMRRKLGIRTGSTKGHRGTWSGTLNCHACGEQCTGQAAMERHARATGHRRYDLPL